MTATLSMVPVAQIRPSKANPRADFDDERMAELIESVKRHGIITPLTLSHDGEGRYAIIAGERRYRAAKAAKLREVPAQVREVEGEALTLAVAENVIRADLSPLEEARAYRRLVDEHGDAAKVAKLVGKSERLVSERLDLLRLPERAQDLLAARATTTRWATVTCSGCGARSRVELPAVDVKSRLQAIQLLLSESLGRAPTAPEVAAPQLPTTVAAVKKMDWRSMQHVFALTYVDEIQAVLREGGPTALRYKLARLSVAERDILREALADSV
jgi:ParB family transcriptional regulator, chromosome partitioning protein